MDKPTMFEPYQAAPDIDVLASYFPIPGIGIVPINAFVLRAVEPVPAAQGMTDTLLGHLAAAPAAPPFVGPDQPAIEAMLSQLAAR